MQNLEENQIELKAKLNKNTREFNEKENIIEKNNKEIIKLKKEIFYIEKVFKILYDFNLKTNFNSLMH